jgi:GDP-L-fucose synthase
MKKVLVTGSTGMLGTLVADALESRGYHVMRHTREIVDLLDRGQTEEFIFGSKPDVIIHCAAVVGGIQANVDGGARFFLENYLIDHNVLTSALNCEVTNLVYIGSSCMYPANQLQPLKVQDLFSGKLESTNEDYAIAKLTGMRLTKSVAELKGFNWRTFIASNLYGPGDHFESEHSHLLASIIYKAFRASRKSLDFITMWGDGTPRREFTYAPDFAEWISRKVDSLIELPLVMSSC